MGYEASTSWSQAVYSTAELQLLLNQMRRVKTTSANSLGWEIHNYLISKGNPKTIEHTKWRTFKIFLAGTLSRCKLEDRLAKNCDRSVLLTRWLHQNSVRKPVYSTFDKYCHKHTTHARTHSRMHTPMHAPTCSSKEHTFSLRHSTHMHPNVSQELKCTHFLSFEAHILM